MSRYPLFDRSKIELRSLEVRGHELAPEGCRRLDEPLPAWEHPEFGAFVDCLAAARRGGRPVVLMFGGHVIKAGLSRLLIDLMERRLVTHLATNGAGLIHDYELALGVGTSEDVARWIREGQFGLWQETGGLNAILVEGAARGEGMGEAIGRAILERGLPRPDLSVAAAGYRLGVPVTAHVSIGSDIIHAHASCDGAALGRTSYTDFLIFARAIAELEQGAYLNVGSAVTGPEVYLKALAMARNVARQAQREIRHFTTAVFDLVDLPADYRAGSPGKDHPLYYYRPWKTILVRTIADGGTSYYFRGDHRATIPTLWRALTARVPRVEAAGAAA